jgi:hypothetical protein
MTEMMCEQKNKNVLSNREILKRSGRQILFGTCYPSYFNNDMTTHDSLKDILAMFEIFFLLPIYLNFFF